MLGSEVTTSASRPRDASSRRTVWWRRLSARLGACDMDGVEPLLENRDQLRRLLGSLRWPAPERRRPGQRRSAQSPWTLVSGTTASGWTSVGSAVLCRRRGGRNPQARRAAQPAARPAAAEGSGETRPAAARTTGRPPMPAAAAVPPGAPARRRSAADPDRCAPARARRGTAPAPGRASPGDDGFRRRRGSRRDFRVRS